MSDSTFTPGREVTMALWTGDCVPVIVIEDVAPTANGFVWVRDCLGLDSVVHVGQLEG